MVDLDSGTSRSAGPSTLSPGQQYTAGDVFAGAGGASRGIERAGVKPLFAVDHWGPAVQSLRSNFPRSQIYNMDVYDFITSDETRRHVDILHLSPPCQFWSPAHTVPGQNDEQNQAVLFCCTDLIEKFRPRLFTVEQTFGILSPKFRQFFNTFLNGFTTHGYSVRWKIMHLCNYGVPQLRKRLIMIGSAPGERLPPFPPATHSKDGASGLKPWATPHSVLAPIPPTLANPLHRPHLRRRFDPPKAPWDPTRLARTITCSGGQNYHWSGERDFTLLEYAVLQGFPTWHRFEGQYVKKQIGNAFAPSVVKILYEHLVEWLLREDGFEASARRGGERRCRWGWRRGVWWIWWTVVMMSGWGRRRKRLLRLGRAVWGKFGGRSRSVGRWFSGVCRCRRELLMWTWMGTMTSAWPREGKMFGGWIGRPAMLRPRRLAIPHHTGTTMSRRRGLLVSDWVAHVL
jgi:DNA (cytosine-5)-methyltransferase 1